MPLRLAAAISVGLAFTATIPGSAAPALANSDPASHVLPISDVFPHHKELRGLAGLLLTAAVDRVYDAGDRIKVAVVADIVDLGGMGALWDQPSVYARYLGETQLRPYFIGPLLVVMPSGFGIYDGAHLTAARESLASRLHVSGGTPDQLIASAADAVTAMLAAGVLRSPDILRPRAATYQSPGTRGAIMKLYYTAYDDSDRAGATLWVTAGGRRIATFNQPLRRLHRREAAFVIAWRVPRRVPRRDAHFCITARDASRNVSPPSCATLSIR